MSVVTIVIVSIIYADDGEIMMSIRYSCIGM